MEWLVCLFNDAPPKEVVFQDVQAADAPEAVQLVMQVYGLAHVDTAVVFAGGHLCLTRYNVWCVLWPTPLGNFEKG